MRKMWMALKEHVGAYDELDMATLRLRLRMPDEPVPDIPQPNIIEPAEVSLIGNSILQKNKCQV